MVIWTDGSVPFSFGKGGSGVLANACFVALRLTFSFQQTKYVQNFPLKPASFCKLSAGPDSTKTSGKPFLFKSASLPFLFFPTLVLSLPLSPLLRLSFYLKLAGRSGRNCLFFSPVQPSYNGPLDNRFSRGTTRLMNLPDGEG